MASAELLVDLLSESDRAVLRMICFGYDDAEIARELGVAYSTVRNRIKRLYAKLSVRDRAGAIEWSYAHYFMVPVHAERATAQRAELWMNALVRLGASGELLSVIVSPIA